MTNTTARILGATDEQTTCDACGRVELRVTVIVGDADGNETGRYGTSCASRVIGRSVTAKDARAAETVRRMHVRQDIRNAQLATDPAARAMFVRDARRTGIVRADESAAIAALSV